ncbi:MAG: EamA/RhaT family transporter [Ruminococcaceae bacterium]|nr:EamA/RhaT family transporter [Oscillospiraceae bacterium]
MNQNFQERLLGLPALLASMVIWGSIGIFRQYIGLPSGLIAFARGLIGMLFLMLVMLIGKRRPDVSAWRKNLIPLCVSGVFLGANWILLFESYNNNLPGHTSVTVATICYYMAPVIVTLLAPFVLRERLTVKKSLCVVVAFAGVILVSLFSGGGTDAGGSQLLGILLALGAAVLYALIVLLNKKMVDICAMDRTVAQLGISAIVMLPYTLAFEPVFDLRPTGREILFLVLIGLLHTGVAYGLYFGSIGRLKAQTAALCSYIDPAVAILLSAIILQEAVGVWGIVGAALVIGAALVGELRFSRSAPKEE